MLEGFVEFLRAGWAPSGSPPSVALAWARLPDARPPALLAPAAVGSVRGFARHLATIDPDERGSLQGPVARRIVRGSPPYIYTRRGDRGADRRRRQAHARRCARLRHQTLIGLLAVNRHAARGGARARPPGCRPARTVWCTSAPASRRSSARCRCTPATIRGAAQTMRGCATRRFPEPSTPAFFIGAQGSARTSRRAQPDIHAADPRGRPRRPRPRASQTPPTRSFAMPCAVHTLLDWHQAGEDIDRQDAAAVCLSRACGPGQHVLVPGGRPRAACADHPPGSEQLPEVLS